MFSNRLNLGGDGTPSDSGAISWPSHLAPETVGFFGPGDSDDTDDAASVPAPSARIVQVGRVDETLFTADDRLPRTKRAALEAEPKLVDPGVTALLLRQPPEPIACSQ